jgi:hypothetical protein
MESLPINAGAAVSPFPVLFSEDADALHPLEITIAIPKELLRWIICPLYVRHAGSAMPALYTFSVNGDVIGRDAIPDLSALAHKPGSSVVMRMVPAIRGRYTIAGVWMGEFGGLIPDARAA